MLLSVILYVPILIVSLIIEIAILIKSRSTDRLTLFFMGIAIGTDKKGNVVGSWLLNKMFIKKWGYQHGSINNTISQVLGINYNLESLTGFGRWFKEFLDLFEADHIIKATNNSTIG